MLRVIFLVWVATLGADRIDFLGGHAFFIVTPFLVLSPLVLLGYCLSRPPEHEPKSSGTIAIPTNFLALMVFFLAVVLASIVFGKDVQRGAIAFSVLFYQTTCTLLITAILLSRSDARDILLRGARLGVLFCYAFSLLELVSWLTGNILEDSDQARGFIFTAAHSFGALAPRLSGVSGDPNRAGLLLLFYWFLLTKLKKNRFDGLLGGLAVLHIFCTLSRSAIISWLVIRVWMLIRDRERKGPVFRWKTAAITVGLVVTLAGVIYYSWDAISTIPDIDNLISDRLSLDSDTSGGIHVELLRRGLEVWSSSPKNVAIGIGYGSAHTVLTDIFQTKYANFHDIYVSVLTECGIVGLATLVILLTWPLRWNTGWVPLLAAFVIFNVFYLSTAEPYFWFSIALVWMSRDSTSLIASPANGPLLRFSVCV